MNDVYVVNAYDRIGKKYRYKHSLGAFSSLKLAEEAAKKYVREDVRNAADGVAYDILKCGVDTPVVWSLYATPKDVLY
jgi:HD superfamily phosphohydrolase YqeK